MSRSLDKFERLVEAFESLPTIGKKSASRLAYHLVAKDNMLAIKLAHAIEDAIGHIKECSLCGGMSEDELCYICCDEDRDASTLCVVESAKDMMLFEQNALFHGLYFVLDDINEDSITSLKLRVANGVEEIIFALTPSIANDALMLFIEDKLSEFDIHYTKIAQGVPTGVSLENIDMLSLSRALKDRVRV
ncbi:MAG: recombination mediator RecR [Sulfuricurvum sp.]|jgi:recombination protein RecR